jgi:transmembrane protein 70
MTRSLGTLNQKSRPNNDVSKVRWINQEEEEEEPEGDTPYVVYEGMLTSQIKGIKLFSITTSLISLALQPAILESTISQNVPLLGTIGIFTMVGFFTFVTPLLIHLMTKKYVAQIRYDPQTQNYTSVTFKFFLQKQEVLLNLHNLQNHKSFCQYFR